ncbi:MAG: CoA transferase [bacterium]|nr:CoA transferase [bacterium]
MIDALAETLDGITVVALVQNIPGPVSAARLRALGAHVTKIEPLRGDPLELASASWYAAVSNGIEIVRLDLREPGALRTLDALLAPADVLLTSVRARSLERIGASWDSLHARYPRLIHVAISGEAPPHDDRAGHDLTYQAHAGTIAPPAMPRTLVGDMAATERAVSATLGALLLRERTGRATRVDVSITGAAADFAQPYRYGLTRADGSLGGALPTYAIYPAEDGWIALAALEPHFIERLQQLLGIEVLTHEALREVFVRRSAAEWERLGEQHDVPLAAIR